MKKILILILGTMLVTSSLMAAEESKHDHKTILGPRGGKVLESGSGHVEFFVQPDRKVSLTFFDGAMKLLVPQAQEVKVIAEAKTGKSILEFEKTADGFVSKTALPEGDGYRVVIQIKPDPSAKPQNFRVDYHSEICKECSRAEYACACAHTGDAGGH